MMNKKLLKRMIDNINDEIDRYIDSEYEMDTSAVALLVSRKLGLSMMLVVANDD